VGGEGSPREYQNLKEKSQKKKRKETLWRVETTGGTPEKKKGGPFAKRMQNIRKRKSVKKKLETP